MPKTAVVFRPTGGTKVVVMSDGKLGIMKTFIVQWFDGICPAWVEQTTQIDGPPTEKDGFIK